jgi:hypothetical protein
MSYLYQKALCHPNDFQPNVFWPKVVAPQKPNELVIAANNDQPIKCNQHQIL